MNVHSEHRSLLEHRLRTRAALAGDARATVGAHGERVERRRADGASRGRSRRRRRRVFRARYVAFFYDAMGPLMLALLPTLVTDWFFCRAAGLVAPSALAAITAGNATTRVDESADNKGAGVANAPN